MSKVKMRCITCGKWFQSANAKEVTCPDCTQKARKEKMASKNTPPAANKPGGGTESGPRPVVPPPPKPKPVQSGTTHWLDSLQDVKVAQPEQAPPRPKPSIPPDRGNTGGYRSPGGPAGYREGGYREDRERGSNYEGRGPGAYREDRDRTPGGYRVGGGSGLPGTTFGQKPRQPMDGPPTTRGPRPERPYPSSPRPPGGKPKGKGKPGARKPSAPPKPKREKIPPPLPFVATPEQVTQVEERYLELAAPLEFDGIRTQIAHELGIPKKAVKKIIKDLRSRQDIPSWWELQTYKGPSEEMERIKAAYLPLLPLPQVGIHKQIAEQLDIKPGIIYQAIKAIRLEMNLPQYNDPTLHGPDFVLHKREKRPKQVEKPAEETSTANEEAVKDSGADPVTPESMETPPEVVPATEGAVKDAEASPATPENTDTPPASETTGKTSEEASVPEGAPEAK
ncbi:MAG: hypothetical protein H0U76_08190 [Ktedonobacteraceae bacterium]|nr:hypothetical protein [Ktedonobacteraceae bacterium]